MSLSVIVAFLGELVVLFSVLIPVIGWVKKLTEGMKCQLRSEMLRIYYHNRENASIRQYEYENFIANYDAYKALKGNSFIDKIYKEMQAWKVIT